MAKLEYKGFGNAFAGEDPLMFRAREIAVLRQLVHWNGGMLLGTEIKKHMEIGSISITGSPKELTFNPNSVNLTLSNRLRVYKYNRLYYSNICGVSTSTIIRDTLLHQEKYKEAVEILGKYNNANYFEFLRSNYNSFLLTLEENNIVSKALDDLEKDLEEFDKYPKYLDMHKDNETMELIIPETGMVLYPGIHYLGSTNERTIVNGFVPKIDGRSSIGRLGLSVHITAGFGDNGFDGTWTLEITVEEPLKIYPNEEICQISFETACGDSNNPANIYRGRYYQQEGPTASRMYLGNLRKDDNNE
jgi:dCTP deaminase